MAKRQQWLCWMIALMIITVWVAGCGEVKTQRHGKASPAPVGTHTSVPVQPTQTVNKGQLVVNFIDVGQGDAILIRTYNKTVLIDSGDVPARDKLIAFLQAQGLKSIDALIVTHPHADHLGGMAAVLSNFEVKEAYDSGSVTSTALFKRYLQEIEKKKIAFLLARPGTVIDLDNGGSIEVLAPQEPLLAGTHSDLNNNSVVCRLAFGDFSLLLTGDAEIEEEERLLASGAKLKSQVVKVGHHGSKTASSPAFLEAVAPEAGVIEVGQNNDYHHPHPSTLTRYEKLHVHLYRTDINGTVTLVSDGKGYQITTER